MNPDFRDLFAEFNAHGVEYLVVGAHALAVHGHVRATKDLDVWVRPDPENAKRVKRSPRYLLKCGCCEEKREIHYAADGFLPLLLIER